VTEDVRIMDGNTFIVSDRNGDVDPSSTFPTGLFSCDTRFLSTWHLLVNGERTHALSVDDLQSSGARYFLVPGAPTHYVDAKVSVIRERCISHTIDEHLTILNHDAEMADVSVRIELGSDFADLFEIKDVRRKKGRHYTNIEDGCLRLGYERGGFRREAVVSTTGTAEIDAHGITHLLRIEPHGRQVIELSVAILGANGGDVRSETQGHPTRSNRELRHASTALLRTAPKLTSDNEQLRTTYRRSLIDLAALQMRTLISNQYGMPAAGLPWFMTTFGRDSIFTSLQALPFIPEFAEVTLRMLGSTQGTRLDDFRDEEPGKILHEIRLGESSAFEEQPQSPYFGTADATPLFIILLDEYERWTGDIELLRRLEMFARASLDWINDYGDLLGNGYLSYSTRNATTGLQNQCWKDSWDSISYNDGRLPGFPRTTCELQGYVYDAKIRAARIARLAWQDAALAERLEREAVELRNRFNRDFWIDDGEYYSLAIDVAGDPVDAMSSNMGHLLWSGIVEPDRAESVVRHLMGPQLFSGWGVRTLAIGTARYNPLGYHVGTVWPFDNSFIAWGLRRYGFKAEAGRIAESVLDAAQYFNGRLPEAFGGYDRELTRYPVEYPTACSPQAWSAGAPLLFLRTILGMEPQGEHLIVEPALPAGIRRIELLDIPGRWGRADAFGRRRTGDPEQRGRLTQADTID
jgi:glycogen debranching enzyme